MKIVYPHASWFWLTLAFSAFAHAADHEPARYSIRCDTDSNLCWQDPQKDAYDMADIGLVATEAERYCAELDLGGFTDWRLPDSDELRALIDGYPATEPGGQCELTIGGERKQTLFRACEGGQQQSGPGDNGCYLQPWLTGTCNKPGPPQATQFLEVWAANRPSDDAEGWQAYVSFDRGALGYNHINSAGDARCVRAIAAATEVREQSALLPGNTFVAQAYEVGDVDPCETSDRLILNIRVPEPLTKTPNRLQVFFYRADKWRFPPAGPPDGGTDYNTIDNPEFSADGLLTTTLPGCTFYRENMLTGDYRVYVQLLMEERRPPMVTRGDYFWGSNSHVFSMPLNGSAHRRAEQIVDLELWPVVQ